MAFYVRMAIHTQPITGISGYRDILINNIQ